MTPTASVEAVQAKLIWLEETAVAVRPVGTVGAVVSAETEADLKAAKILP